MSSLYRDLINARAEVEALNEGRDYNNENVQEEVLCEGLVEGQEIMTLYECPECGALHEHKFEGCSCGCESLDEAIKLVVRGGKVIKKQVKLRRKKLSSKQKRALAKARKKANTSSAKRARAKSMKVRKARVHESEELECPECGYIGEMDEIEEGVFVCPECGAKLEYADVDESKKGCSKNEEPDDDYDDDDYDDEDESINETLQQYIDTLKVPSKYVNEGADSVKQFLCKEYGIFL